MVASCIILLWRRFSFFTITYITVWRYRYGHINLADNSYIFHLIKKRVSIAYLCRNYYEKIRFEFIFRNNFWLCWQIYDQDIFVRLSVSWQPMLHCAVLISQMKVIEMKIMIEFRFVTNEDFIIELLVL